MLKSSQQRLAKKILDHELDLQRLRNRLKNDFVNQKLEPFLIRFLLDWRNADEKFQTSNKHGRITNLIKMLRQEKKNLSALMAEFLIELGDILEVLTVLEIEYQKDFLEEIVKDRNQTLPVHKVDLYKGWGADIVNGRSRDQIKITLSSEEPENEVDKTQRLLNKIQKQINFLEDFTSISERLNAIQENFLLTAKKYISQQIGNGLQSSEIIRSLIENA